MDDVEKERAEQLITARTEQLRSTVSTVHKLKEALEDILERAQKALEDLNKA